jgi:hypothetical protein
MINNNSFKDISHSIKSKHLFDFLLSLLFIIIYFNATKEWKFSELDDLANFTAYNPFQQRILIPFIVGSIKKIIPGFSYILLYQIILLIITFILVKSVRIYLKQYFTDNLSVNIGILVLFYVLFWNYPALGIWIYPADIPAILFFVIGLIFLRNNKFLKFYPVFIVACFYRETITNIHIVILYSVTWLLIKYLLYLIFQNNPSETTGGNIFLMKIYENLEFLKGLLKLDKFYILRVFSFGALYIFIPALLKYLDDFHKKILLLIPIYIFIIFFVGKFQEVRIYSELVPLFIVPGVYLLKNRSIL